MLISSDRPRRWPACVMALLLLGYATGKAAFALQARLGFPGGPPVPAAEAAGYFLDPALGQWLACASGLLGAVIALATVTPAGRRLPRALMLVVLAVMTPAVVGGGGIMALDGFIGVGVGWQWYHGVLGVVAIVLTVEMSRSYLVATRARTPR
ncbi:hypothetical protein HCN51_04335 [Nonomuraea sp. FMUSA5-5]|uniref:DUF998 domain-containing protein n=1 Tax=Nonomuraea composti TaxID=2720023 RepID=A0ABX1B129_9ACTN|nr:hypothetical protein [Nonomuraea sp. FMUSA5-5]NJP88693.1 hypothetical protein [Nonomuraea sp. FMUSA5-5]